MKITNFISVKAVFGCRELAVNAFFVEEIKAVNHSLTDMSEVLYELGFEIAVHI